MRRLRGQGTVTLGDAIVTRVTVRSVPGDVPLRQQLFIWMVLLAHDRRLCRVPAVSGLVVSAWRGVFYAAMAILVAISISLGIFVEPVWFLPVVLAAWFLAIVFAVRGSPAPIAHGRDAFDNFRGRDAMGPPPGDPLLARYARRAAESGESTDTRKG